MKRRCSGPRLLAACCLLLAPLCCTTVRAESALAKRAARELSRGRLREASKLLQQELVSPRSDPDSERASLLLLLAHAEVNLGRYREGLEAARQALSLYESSGDTAGQAEAHFRVGTAHDELAEYDESHRHYHRALEGFRGNGDRRGEARVLSAFGTSFRFLGDPATAATYHEQARRHFAEMAEEASVCFEHRHLGNVLEDLERLPEARDQYRRALELLPRWDRGWVRADILFHLGRLEARSSRDASAGALLSEGLAFARSSQNRWAEALILAELARLGGEQGAVKDALPLALESVHLLREMGAQDLEWDARFVHASLLDRAGQWQEAIVGLTAALELLESVRSSIGQPLLRSRYTPKSRPVYEALLRLEARRPDRTDEERAARTFEIAELSRARSFAEMLLESRTVSMKNDSEEEREERTLRAKADALRTRLTRFANTVADREALEQQLVETERRHAAILLELRRSDSRYRESARSLPLPQAEAARLVGQRVDLVAYHLGEGSSFGWLLNAEGLRLYELPRRGEIENLVLLFTSLVRHRNDPLALERASRQLYDLLLEPIAGALVAGRSLVVVPDGALFYLPFEALILPGADRETRYLIEERTVHYLPSTTVLAELREREMDRPRTEKLDLLAFGDPRPHVEALEPRLFHAGSEVRRIAGLFNTAHTLHRVGPEASESALRQLAARPARILHLATHGVLDGAHLERSGLLLAAEEGDGGDGFLNLFEIFDMNISSDLVVLSACETARGELLRGEGIVGLAGGFLLAGGRAVVASLWKVDDRSTEELMAALYRRLGSARSVAEALRQAKLDWLRSSGSERSDPFPWAAFVLIGDGEIAIPLRRAPRWGALTLLGLGVLILSGALAAVRHARVRVQVPRG